MGEKHLGVDIGFDEDFITLPTGDVETVDGRKCLLQDIRHRLITPRGDLWAHPEYGVRVYEFLQDEDTEINRLDLQQMIAGEIEQDPRVVPGSASVEVISWDRDRIRLRATFQPVDDGNPINLVLGYSLMEITAEVVSGSGL